MHQTAGASSTAGGVDVAVSVSFPGHGGDSLGRRRETAERLFPDWKAVLQPARSTRLKGERERIRTGRRALAGRRLVGVGS